MIIIPLTPVPAQVVTINLSNQPCQIRVYQRYTGLYMDLSVNDGPIINGRICENLNRIVRSTYLGFVGDLCFIDNQGSDDPDYTGLGFGSAARYSLAYLTPVDLAASDVTYGD